MRPLSTLAALLLLLAGATDAAAATYHVAPGGNDADDGLTPATAFATLQRAADAVAAGDLVLVADGTYAGFDLRDVNGTPTQRITFRATGAGALINQAGPLRDDGINVERADYVTVEGFVVVGMTGVGNGIRVVESDFAEVRDCRCDANAERGIFTAFADDVLVERNVCTNSVAEHGIYCSNSGDRPTVRYNECSGNNWQGLHFNADASAGGDGVISDARVYGNVIHGNGLAAGITMDGLEAPWIYNNLIYDNADAQGIACYGIDGAIATRNARIFNNTILVPADGRWGILLDVGANPGTEIYNNIILSDHPFRGAITAESTAGLSSDYNLLADRMSATGDGSSVPLAAWQALGLDLNSSVAPPASQLFVDAGAADFQLAANSAAVDAGTATVSAVVTDDITGAPRPQGADYDIGAYESTAPLPVELLAPVTARHTHDATGAVEVRWSTARERDVQAFRVARSRDGAQWTTLGRVAPTGRTRNDYRFVDASAPAGALLYEVVELRTDGHTRALGRAAVSMSTDEVRVFPNPTRASLHVQLGAAERAPAQVSLLDASGKLVRSYRATDTGALDVSTLPVGTYRIRIQLPDGRTLERQVVKH